jgi:hypothetical protein
VAKPAQRAWTDRAATALAGALCLLHGYAVWIGLDGREGLLGAWPLAKHDHPLYFHSSLVTREFLRQSGTTAGYDPSFMAGYAKSIIFPASSTLPELVVAAFGEDRPVLAYKLYVLVSVAAVPWFVLIAARRLGPPGGAAPMTAVLLFLVYLWTDFPIQYATYGMVPYLIAVPLAMAALGSLTALLECGRRRDAPAAAVYCWAAVLVHFTTAMVLVPAALVAYLARSRHAPSMSRRQHWGFWLVPVVVVVGNVFWWWPGPWLAATKGPSGFAFAHPEGVFARLLKVFTTEAAIQPILWALGLPGLVLLARRTPVAAVGLAGFATAGFAWGYAAGAFRFLDFLQPGRHTYALYTALAAASGATIAIGIGRLKRPLRVLAVLGGSLILARLSGGALVDAAALNLGNPFPRLTRWADPVLATRLRFRKIDPFLSSRPTPTLRWVVDRVKRHVRAGERLLYEEGGFSVAGLVEPFGEGRYSGLIPYFAPGVEVLGGPYLHAALATNFTQFGEGRLFGKEDWTRADFERYARLYRPSAILCWSPRSRSFCRSHPDIITILEDTGSLLIARVRGFEGVTIEGQAAATAEPGRLHVRPGGELDDPPVLRYHFVPHLRANPPTRLEPVFQGDDPVPFIGLRPPAGGTTIGLSIPPSGR